MVTLCKVHMRNHKDGNHKDGGFQMDDMQQTPQVNIRLIGKIQKEVSRSLKEAFLKLSATNSCKPATECQFLAVRCWTCS